MSLVKGNFGIPKTLNIFLKACCSISLAANIRQGWKCRLSFGPLIDSYKLTSLQNESFVHKKYSRTEVV